MHSQHIQCKRPIDQDHGLMFSMKVIMFSIAKPAGADTTDVGERVIALWASRCVSHSVRVIAIAL